MINNKQFGENCIKKYMLTKLTNILRNMKHIYTILTIALVTTFLFNSMHTTNTIAQEDPLTPYKKIPGANITMPINIGQKSFPLEFVKDARTYFNNFHMQMGGDHAVYYVTHLSEYLPTSVILADGHVKEFVYQPNLDVANVRLNTNIGELTLDQYVSDPKSRTQGFLIVHHGKIVYEAYPGMRPSDTHLWASTAKTTVGLVLAQLEAEGKINLQSLITDYLPDFKGTSWDGIKIIDALNMVAGLDNEETYQSIFDPNSVIVRFFSSMFGNPPPGKNVTENWIDVLKDTKKLDEAPGTKMRYSSALTQIPVAIAEKIENKTWSEIFKQHVWSKIGARGPLLINLTPDGTAIPMGMVSSTLQDFARYAMQFTPSWNKAANTQIVTPDVLKRMQTGGSPDAFKGSEKWKSGLKAFGEAPLLNSFQWDMVFTDGAMFKSGNLGQGIYVDPSRDVIGVYFSTNPGETFNPTYIREAAKVLAGW